MFVMYDELITNFVLALVAVAVLSILVLGQFAIVILVCLTVVRRHAYFLFSVVNFYRDIMVDRSLYVRALEL